MKTLNYIAFLYCIAFLIGSCNTHEDDGHVHDPASVDNHEEEMESPNTIHLTEQQLQNIEVQFQKIENRALKSIVKINGRVELPPNGTAVVSSPLEGQIVKMNTIPGQFVRKGQVLFTVRNLELIQWRETYAKTKAEIDYLEKELARQQDLNKEAISSDKELQKVESQLLKANISLNSLKERMEVINVDPEGTGSSFNLVAPQSGVVQHVNVHQGSFISTNSELVDIINDKHMRIHLFAFGKDINKLTKGQKINFFVQSRPNQVREAKIVWINNVVNQENNSYEVHADIIGDLKGFSPGEFVEARVIETEELLPSLQLSAIAFDKGLPYIFINEGIVEHDHGPETGDSHEHEYQFRKLLISTGVTDLGFAEIIPVDPIPENAQVVVNGAFFLMAQTKKDSGISHSHDH